VSDQPPGLFTDYINDVLTSHIATDKDNPGDFIIRQSADELIYVDVEDNKLYLITVKKGHFVVGGKGESGAKEPES